MSVDTSKFNNSVGGYATYTFKIGEKLFTYENCFFVQAKRNLEHEVRLGENVKGRFEAELIGVN